MPFSPTFAPPLGKATGVCETVVQGFSSSGDL
jgi:hypothetical protein